MYAGSELSVYMVGCILLNVLCFHVHSIDLDAYPPACPRKLAMDMNVKYPDCGVSPDSIWSLFLCYLLRRQRYVGVRRIAVEYQS